MHSYENILAYVNKGDLQNAKKYLEENIREENQDRQGFKTSDKSIIKRLQNSTDRRDLTSHVSKFEFDGMEFYGVTNGYYMLGAKDDMGLSPFEAGHEFNIQRVIGIRPTDMIGTSPNFIRYELDLADLKTFVSKEKARVKYQKVKTPKAYIIEYGNGKYRIGFNPYYLADCCEFAKTTDVYLGIDKSRLSRDGYCCVAPAYFYNNLDHRFTMCLPVNLKKPEEEKERQTA